MSRWSVATFAVFRVAIRAYRTLSLLSANCVATALERDAFLYYGQIREDMVTISLSFRSPPCGTSACDSLSSQGVLLARGHCTPHKR